LKPDGATPHAISEFYGYDHTYSPLCYTSTIGPVTFKQTSAIIACGEPVAITLYINGPETYTQSDCSVMAQDGFYGDGSGGYYEVSGGSLSSLQTCASPSPSVTPTPTTPAGTIAWAETVSDLCTEGATYTVYYTSPSCSTSLVAGCKAYYNPSLTNLVTDVGYVGNEGSANYYAYTNPGPANNYQATGLEQTCPSPSPTPSVTPTVTPSPCYGSTVYVSLKQTTATLACSAPQAITLYIAGGGIEVYTAPDCSTMAQDGYYGDGSGGYYEVDGGSLSSLQTCASPSPSVTPTPSVTAGTIAWAETVSDLCTIGTTWTLYYTSPSCGTTVGGRM